MHFSQIMDSLAQHHPTMVRHGHDIRVDGCKVIVKGQTHFSPGYLYCGAASSLGNQAISSEGSAILCIEDCELPASFACPTDMGVALVPSDTSLTNLFNDISDLLSSEMKTISLMRDLIDPLLAGAGLQSLANNAAALFGNPVIVNDSAYRILAFSDGPSFEEETLDEEKITGLIHESNIKDMRRDGIFQKMQEEGHAFYSKSARMKKGFLFSPVRIHGITIGSVAVVEEHHAFGPDDYELAEWLSQIVAVEMREGEFYRDNKGVMYSFLLSDLINEKLTDRDVIERRFTLLGWKTRGWYQLMTLTGRGLDNPTRALQQMGEDFRSLIPGSRWTVSNHHLVLFVDRPSQEMLSDGELRVVEDFLESNALSMGISDPFDDLTKANKHYRQAKAALRLGNAMRPHERLHYYCDVILDRVASILAANNSLQDFYHPGFLILKEHDEETGSQLTETLRIWLKHPFDPALAAKELVVHRNTLLYRLNKIREMTGLSLADGDELLKLALSLKFEEYEIAKFSTTPN